MKIEEFIKKYFGKSANEEILNDMISTISEEIVDESSIMKVANFHKLFQHPVGSVHKPELITMQAMFQRVVLLYEEVIELAEACGSELLSEFREYIKKENDRAIKNSKAINVTTKLDMVEVIDAIVDIQYILDGTSLTFGVGSVVHEAFDVVHENNMNKATTDREIAMLSVKHYATKGIKLQVEEVQLGDEENHRFVLTCVHDDNGIVPLGKIMKPINHRKVNLADIYEKYKNKKS
jgi:predicted HAD superfamily Cof-like phosphohydrolase